MPGFVVSIGVMRLEKRGSMAVSLSDVISASETGSNHCPGRPAPRLIQTLRKHLRAPLQQSLKVARTRYHRWRSGKVEYEDLTPQHKAFFLALSSLTHRIEDAKIALSRSVTSWNLDSPSEQAVTVAMPEDPFKSDSLMVSVRYSLSDLRKLFITGSGLASDYAQRGMTSLR